MRGITLGVVAAMLMVFVGAVLMAAGEPLLAISLSAWTGACFTSGLHLGRRYERQHQWPDRVVNSWGHRRADHH
jgi:hypothetical protein